jgi:hypothetical protein
LRTFEPKRALNENEIGPARRRAFSSIRRFTLADRHESQ